MHPDVPPDCTSFAVTGGRFSAVPADGEAFETVDAGGRVVLPGFIDCHTHALYCGDRRQEHEMRRGGKTYEEIALAGGGIKSTVGAVRAATHEELIADTLPRLEALRAEGVTTVEIKSGYGLDRDNELKMLEAIAALPTRIDMDVSATFLGAHAVPDGQDAADYIGQIIDDLLPEVASRDLASAVDIYVESIAFSVEDMTRLFERASALGLACRAHTEQLTNSGGARAAAAAGARSCDHLEYLDDAGAEAMGRSGAVAVLLPGAFYFLQENKKPPVELLRRHGVPIAIASDLNPGTSPLASLLTALHLASTLFGLTPDEALAGVTINAARALGRADEIGAIAPGYHADFSLWDIADPDFLLYQLGGVKPAATYFRGQAMTT